MDGITAAVLASGRQTARALPGRGGSEHDHQAALFQLIDLYAPQYPVLWQVFAIPNGGPRHPATGARLKAEGVRAGVWDVCCAWPAHGYHGAFLELKVGRNTLTPEQSVWRERFTAAGYYTHVAYEWRYAWAALANYLDLPPHLWQQFM